MAPVIVKVGGSLFDLPDLGERLRRWIAKQAWAEVAIVPGGGAITDVVRGWDRRHSLGEETSHWLALSALSLNAQLLAKLISSPDPPVLEVAVSGDIAAWPELWKRGKLPILDANVFARMDETRRDHLPHSWDVTSDSIAARVASLVRARRLVLMKSITIPDGMSWSEASASGFVDPHFPQVVGGLNIKSVNFREGLAEVATQAIALGSRR